MDDRELSAPPPHRGYRWIPTLDLVPGMVIARPVFGAHGPHLTIHLGVGGTLTASTISQLVNKGVECVAVLHSDTAENGACERAPYEARLHEIFGAAPDESCRALLDALLADGPDPC